MGELGGFLRIERVNGPTWLQRTAAGSSFSAFESSARMSYPNGCVFQQLAADAGRRGRGGRTSAETCDVDAPAGKPFIDPLTESQAGRLHAQSALITAVQ